MRATGIVRRIDDLGRVVIPKEIRRTMRIREGDPLEIYTDRDGEVIFKKYSPVGELSLFAAQYAETVSKTCGIAIVITDRDSVIACAGVPKKEYLEHKLTPEAEQAIEARQFYARHGENGFSVIDGGHEVGCLMPIITEGDLTGSVISLRTGDEKAAIPPELEAKLVQTAAGFLGKQIEE